MKALLAGLLTLVAIQTAAAQQGRISGQVVDRETGRPLASVQLVVVGQGLAIQSDLDGRFRTPPLPSGKYSVRATLIGFRPAQRDSIAVEADRTTDVSFTLTAVALEIEGITVEAAAAPVAKNTDAGLLSAQQAAGSVRDGISAQGIARTPDANAGEAVRRMTGVTLFGGKFLVVRGLGERYSNALLNGAEMPNPVVEKKIPPLDLFPAGLIASVVANKTATPDIPGDFAGGSVDLVTKDFPESRLLQFSISQAMNDRTTFQDVPIRRRSATDLIGIDNGGRQAPFIPFGNLTMAEQKPILQAFPDNVWNPAPRRVLPGLGLNATYGNQWQGAENALGTIVSLTYNNGITYTPERLSNLFYLTNQAASNVSWGGIANISYRLGASHKLGWKNMYTRSAEETSIDGQGSEGITFHRQYQMRYVERYLWQSQLTGEHHLNWSTVSWSGTTGRAQIDDPDNHSADYATLIEPGATPSVGGKRLVRTLSDLTRSGKLDWSIPLSLRRSGDGLIKAGAYYRRKHRDYDAHDVIILRSDNAAASGLDGVIETLPPEQVFAPENLGTYFSFIASANHNDPFFADDNVGAAYGMVDIPVLSRLRLVTGLRAEQWDLLLRPGGNDPEGNWLKYGLDSVIAKHSLDLLWSSNVTYAFTEKMNLRLAAYRTLARPDSREISPGQYTPIAGFGNCTEQGNPKLQRSLVTSGDIRWEVYPNPGEILAVSAFYKHFDLPIVEQRTTGGFNNSNVACTIANAQSAEVRGAELELRKTVLGRLGVGLNLTAVTSSIRFDPFTGLLGRQFIGQSPFVANGYLAYEPEGGKLQASLLYNYFGDRITKFSNTQRANALPYPNPNWVERGRHTVDAKLQLRLARQLKWQLSVRNLTRSAVVIAEDAGERRIVEYYNPGVTFSTALTRDF